MNSQLIIKKLENIEAWAEGLQEECRKTRRLIEAGVSTSAKNQGLSSLDVARLVSARKKSLLNKKSR